MSQLRIRLPVAEKSVPQSFTLIKKNLMQKRSQHKSLSNISVEGRQIADISSKRKNASSNDYGISRNPNYMVSTDSTNIEIIYSMLRVRKGEDIRLIPKIKIKEISVALLHDSPIIAVDSEILI